MDLTGLVGRLEKFGTDLAGKPVFRWGVVTGSDPLRLQLDGDAVPLEGSPATLVGDLQVGDRVRVEQQAARLTVHGKALAKPEATGVETVGVARVPKLVHAAGVQKVDLIRTARVRLMPGLYRVTWPVKYTITRTSSDTAVDASGAYLHVYKLEGDTPTRVQWANGSAQVESWGSYWRGEGYGNSSPEGGLQVAEPGDYEFVAGLHSYLKLKMETWESTLVVEKFPRALEINVSKIN